MITLKISLFLSVKQRTISSQNKFKSIIITKLKTMLFLIKAFIKSKSNSLLRSPKKIFPTNRVEDPKHQPTQFQTKLIASITAKAATAVSPDIKTRK